MACGNKVVWRANASEKVGVTVQSEGNMYIIEYSEIPTDMRDAADEKGRLIFGAANICNHFLTVQFIVDSILPNLSSNYHSASKKIPYMDPTTKETVTPTQNNGVKLEMFIFDVFPLAQRNWLVIEGDREDEFAPVKNEPGNPQDSPDTALKAISDQGINLYLFIQPSTLTNTHTHALIHILNCMIYCGMYVEKLLPIDSIIVLLTSAILSKDCVFTLIMCTECDDIDLCMYACI